MNAEAWRLLEDRALWLLEHADQTPPVELLHGMGLQLRLWQYPLTGPHHSWSIILPAREYRGRPAVVREVAWDQHLDWKLSMSPVNRLKRRQPLEPTVRVRDAQVAWFDLAPFFDAAGGLPTAKMGEDPLVGSEEDAFGLEGARSLAHIRLRWVGKGPHGWGSTIAWFGRFRRLLVRVMHERDLENREG